MNDIAEEQKKRIDKMSHYDLCYYWRHAKSDDKLLKGLTGEYLKERLFKHFGGFTPRISKSIGW